MGLYHYYHRTAAIELNIRSALKGSRIGDRQFRTVSRHRFLPRKAVFIRFAVEGHGEAADFIQLLLNVQTTGNNAISELFRILGVGDLMISVRLGVQPAFDVP